MGVQIRLTGLVTLQGEDEVRRHLPTAQARLAFARLTLDRDRGTTREELADTVWPEVLPATWRSALRTLVSRVRAFVAGALDSADDPLVTQDGRYLLRLPPDVTVDVEEGESAIVAARTAVATGDPLEAQRLALEGADLLRPTLLPDCEGVWVAGVREHLTELLVSGLELASHATVALGDNAGGLVLANEAVARAPLRESAHRCRMAAHAAAGNRAEALRAYQRLRRVLIEELGVSPEHQTESAYLALLGPTSAPARSAGGGRGGWPERSHEPFVGREREMALLTDAWAATVDQPLRQLVVVSGEAGLGKTRLAMELGRQLTLEGGLLLFGRCDREAIVPYQPFVEALDGYVAATPDDELPLLPPSSRCALAAVLPSLIAPGPPPVAVDRFRLFDAVTKLVVSATREQPVLLVLDDLQWADADTLPLLRHVLRHSRGTRLLVVAITRDQVRSPHPLTDVVRAIDCEGWLTRLPLGGLDEAAVTALLGQRPEAEAGPPLAEAARRLLAETAGNPFMLLELLPGAAASAGHRSAARSGPVDRRAGARPAPGVPAGIHDLVADRLAALSATTRALLHAAAIAGSTFDLRSAGYGAGLDEATALDALDGAVDAGLVVEVEARHSAERAAHRYRFTHDVVRRALDHQVSAARRRYLHVRLAHVG